MKEVSHRRTNTARLCGYEVSQVVKPGESESRVVGAGGSGVLLTSGQKVSITQRD